MQNVDINRTFGLLTALILFASACGSGSTAAENAPVDVSVIDDGRNSDADADATEETQDAETTDSGAGTATQDAETTGAAEQAGDDDQSGSDPEEETAAAPSGSPGSVCRAAGFDFEPWLTICSEAQAKRAEQQLTTPLDDIDLTIPVEVGDRIADGVPANGAGYMSEANETVAYTFELAAGEAAYVAPQADGWTQGCGVGFAQKAIDYQIFAPDGTPLGPPEGNSNCSWGSFAAPAVEDGTYTLLVGAWANVANASTEGVSTYAFGVSAIQVDRFTVATGDLIEPGSHGPGSADIETAGSADVYTLPLQEGDEINLIRRAFNGICGVGSGPGLAFTLTHPSGEVLVDRLSFTGNCSRDDGEADIVADTSGDYVLTISGTDPGSLDKAADYVFELVPLT